MLRIKCDETDCPHHALKHFEHLAGENRLLCHAPVVLLKRKEKKRLGFACVEDRTLGRLRRME